MALPVQLAVLRDIPGRQLQSLALVIPGALRLDVTLIARVRQRKLVTPFLRALRHMAPLGPSLAPLATLEPRLLLLANLTVLGLCLADVQPHRAVALQAKLVILLTLVHRTRVQHALLLAQPATPARQPASLAKLIDCGRPQPAVRFLAALTLPLKQVTLLPPEARHMAPAAQLAVQRATVALRLRSPVNRIKRGLVPPDVRW